MWFVSYEDMIRCLGAGLIIQPIVSFLQTISLAKSFAKKPPQYQIDPTQVISVFISRNKFVKKGIYLVWFG